MQRTTFDRRCVLAKSPQLTKIHNDSNGRVQKMRQPIKITKINRNFSLTDDERHIDRDQRLNFIELKKHERIPLSTTTSSSSSLASLSSSLSSSTTSSPSHLTPSHIKLKSTFIPTQYRVYIPQKKCEMKHAYTDYVYSTGKTTITKPNQILSNSSHDNNNECPTSSSEQCVDTIQK